MRRLAGMDASFVYMETPSAHMHVVGTLVLDPSSAPKGYSFERVKHMIESRLHLLEPFRRKLVMVPFGIDHPVWIEDPDFDIDRHLRRGALPSPGSMRELAAYVGDVAGRALDRNYPLWELHVVEGLENGNVALVTKMHHSAMDGVSGADLMVHLFDLEPDTPDPEPPAEEWKPDAVPSDAALVVDALASRLRSPLRMTRVFAKTARAAVDIARNAVPALNPNASGSGVRPALPFTAPRTRFSGAITPHRSVAFGKADLEDLRFVKSTFGTTVNDVVLAACTQTLRHYLAAHDDLPDQPLVCSVPVSVHAEGNKDTTNQVSTMFVRLPVQLSDPVEQLRTIRAETVEAKEMQNAIGADMLQDWAEFLPGTLFNRAMRLYSSRNLADRHRPIHNLVISNIPGPPIPLYSAGARVLGVYPFGPLLEGAGMNITVLSNMGNMDFGIIACTESVPDIWDIADGFGEAVTALKVAAEKEAGRAALPAAPKSRPAKKPAPTPKPGD